MRRSGVGASCDDFPFTIASLGELEEVRFETPVTFLVGENGSGKSTLLETIAVGIGAHAIGATDLDDDRTLAGARRLAATYRFARSGTPSVRTFFRAEDAFGFTRRIENEMTELRGIERSLLSEGSASLEARSRAAGFVAGQRRAFEGRYGVDPHAFSHGETFLQILQRRFVPRGLFLLDEPETPFSPLRILALMALIIDAVAVGSQFIIATHSPILLSMPGARILVLDDRGVTSVPFAEVEHVTLTRDILAHPETFTRFLGTR